MRRVLVFFAAAVVLLTGSHLRAQAMSEICPAHLYVFPVNGEGQKHDHSTVFGFQLSAATRRAVSATVDFYTDAGWYSVALPASDLLQGDLQYTSSDESVAVSAYLSKQYFVRFPASVVVNRAFLVDAVTNDPFWKSKVTCLNGSAIRESTTASRFLSLNIPVATPRAGDSILEAKSAPPLGDTSCATPFSETTAKDVVTPDFPNVNGMMDSVVSVVVDLVVDETGKIRDAWYAVPSPYPQMNKASLNAALATHYTPEVSLCQKVPSEYLFTVTYNPFS